MLKLVPFSSAWVGSSKLDLKAVYRRPRWTMNEFDESVQVHDVDGAPVWDLTTPLRVMDHNKHLAKGFEYLTLATRDDLIKAAKAGTVANWREYDQHQTGGPWNAKMYMAGAKLADTALMQQLRDQIRKFGWETVEEIRRQSDPSFRVPEVLKQPLEAQPVAEADPVEKRAYRKREPVSA